MVLGPIRGEAGDLSKLNRDFEAGGFVYSAPRVSARLFVFLRIISFTEVLDLLFLKQI